VEAEGAVTGDSMPGAEVVPRWSRAVGVAVVDVPDADEQPSEAGGEHPADGSAVPEAGGVVYLAPLPDGPVAVLSGASAVLYRALVAGDGDPVARVSRDLGVSPEDVDAEAIDDFADELVEAGLIVRHGAGQPGAL